MNPDTNKFEQLFKEATESPTPLERSLKEATESLVIRSNGKPVPKHWTIFQVDENYIINNYTFRCKYIGETSILFEPVGQIIIGEKDE
jgi:hypothetical protein